ncbi:MAG: hypothetical protein A2Y17_05695 [Clostridiales bacterium GWF2_38_85]|nr:MAG: hypothetical protein A2Y17_05695 [Clostridiales bacterium GWF2_38_85]HBL84025.1 hypothetical protein [Clostridiales bacterium]
MKKTLSFIMVLLILTTVFSACSQNGNNSSSVAENTISEDASDDTSSETSEKTYVADIPEKDYEGLEIKILTRLTNFGLKGYTEFGFGEELEANAINTAVANRNAAVEELLNIKITEVGIIDDSGMATGQMMNEVRQAAASGQDDYYIIAPQLYQVAILASEGLFYNLYDFEYLHDLSAEWWDQNFIKETSIADKAFFAIGDIGFFAKNSLTVCYFNKNMFEEYDLPDPYELVKQNKWTLDQVISWSKLVKSDLDNDQVINYKDKFGVGGQNDMMWAMFYGCGETLAEKDVNGMPIVDVYNTRSVKVMSKILELMNDKNYFVCANDYWNEPGYTVSPSELITNAFMTNRCLLYFESLNIVEDLRNMEASIDFGILPVPMYDENQGGYYHLVNPWGGNAFAIPQYIGAEKAEIASIVMEALGAAGKNIVTPAYYDVALKKQKTRDNDSQEMLDLIFSTISVDVGHIYNWGNMGFSLLHAMIGSDEGKFTTLWQSMETSVQAAVEQTVDAFEQIP